MMTNQERPDSIERIKWDNQAERIIFRVDAGEVLAETLSKAAGFTRREWRELTDEEMDRAICLFLEMGTKALREQFGLPPTDTDAAGG